jgi:hypothetical protein
MTMPRLSHTTICLCAAAGVLTALAAWEEATDGSGESPIGRIFVPGMHRIRQRREQLQAHVAAQQDQRRQTHELVVEIAAGRTTLPEGAARLRELYRPLPPIVWECVCRRMPDVSDEERYCRLVIGEVLSYVEVKDPGGVEAMNQRLESELQEHLRQSQ